MYGEKGSGTMTRIRYSVPLLITTLLFAPLLITTLGTITPVCAESLQLTFAKQPAAYMIGTEAYPDRWSYYVTRGVSLFPITNKSRVARYLNWGVDGDPTACSLNTRANYVALVRRVPESFARASRLEWQWQVTQDTPLGRFGSRPDDQAVQVILIFKRTQPEKYMALSFTWTRDARRDDALYTTRLPQDGFPVVKVAVHRLRSGLLPVQRESIDIREAFQAAAGLHGDDFTDHGEAVPNLFGIVLFGESSNQRPPVDPKRMSTRAFVSNVELIK